MRIALGPGGILRLPLELRERLGITPGCIIRYKLVGDVVQLRIVRVKTLRSGAFRCLTQGLGADTIRTVGSTQD